MVAIGAMGGKSILAIYGVTFITFIAYITKMAL